MGWTNETSLNTSVTGPAAVTADAVSPAAGYSIYAIGGNDGTSPVGTVQAYDTATQTWSAVTSMPTSRLNLAAASGPGRVYAIGGSDGAAALANNEIFNPAGNDWTAGAPLLTARERLGAAIGPDGLIYVVGGHAGTTHLNTVEAYDPATNTWASLPGMPTARSGLAVVAGPDGLIYAIGGVNNSGTLDTVEVFDIATGTWSAGKPLPTPTWALAAAVGPDGLIYAFGGLLDNGMPLNTTYAYDTGTAAWTAQAAMLTPQAFLAGTTGPDGLIYAIGGQNFTEFELGTVEAFTTGTALTTDPYIGNGTYQSPDIILLDPSNNPVPLGGAPGGAWDTLLVPNTDYGFQAVVYNDSNAPAMNTVVGFWHFPGGVGTSGTLIDQQTVTVPANGSIVVASANPFQSGPPLAHECAVVSLYCPGSPYFDVNPTTAAQVIDPTVPHPAGSGHFGSAWRNTNSYTFGGGMRWLFPFQLSPLPEPHAVGLAAHAVKVPAGWDRLEEVAEIRRALEFAGAANRLPLFLVPGLRARLPEADLGLRLHGAGGRGGANGGPKARHEIVTRKGEPAAFYLSGTVPQDAQPGDIFLVTVEARYPEAGSKAARVVDYLEVIYVK
jgi:hypothetical protein